MAEGQTPEPKRTSRRGFLKIAGAGVGGAAVGAALDRLLGSSSKPAEISPTFEQAEKQNSLRELKDFMEKYTTDKTVSNFLANATPDDINKSFTLTQEDSLSYASPVNAWNLRVPVGSGETIISYRNKKMNPNEGSGNFQNVRVYLGKDGRIVETSSSEVPTTLDETKHAFDQFTSRPILIDSDWHKDESGLRNFSAGPRPIEGGKEIFVGAHAEGLMSITIRDAEAPASPPPPPSSVGSRV